MTNGNSIRYFYAIQLPRRQFKQDHFGSVPVPGSEFDDTGITTVAVFKARTNFVKQFFNHFFIGNGLQHLAARMHVAAFRQRYDFFYIPTHSFGFGFCGLYAFVLENLCHQALE